MSACTPPSICSGSCAVNQARRGRVTVVAPTSYMTYQPFLPEAAAGNLEPRHVVVSLRRTLKAARSSTAASSRRPRPAPRSRSQPPREEARTTSYDVLVVAVGSISRTLPIPGLAEDGIGFKQIEEAIAPAQPRARPARPRRVDPRPRAARRRPDLRLRRRRVRRGRGPGRDSRTWPATRPATTPPSTQATCSWCWSRPPTGSFPRSARTWAATRSTELRERGIEVRLGTRLDSAGTATSCSRDGDEFDADTPGVDRGRQGHTGARRHRPPAGRQGPAQGHRRPHRRGSSTDVWTAGDNAAVPDLTEPGGVLRAQRPARRAAGRRCSPTTSWPRCAASR